MLPKDNQCKKGKQHQQQKQWQQKISHLEKRNNNIFLNDAGLPTFRASYL